VGGGHDLDVGVGEGRYLDGRAATKGLVRGQGCGVVGLALGEAESGGGC
jgi:hypothetical protein